MRTTLAIDDDVHAIAKRLAAVERQSVDSVLSALARQPCGCCHLDGRVAFIARSRFLA